MKLHEHDGRVVKVAIGSNNESKVRNEGPHKGQEVVVSDGVRGRAHKHFHRLGIDVTLKLAEDFLKLSGVKA